MNYKPRNFRLGVINGVLFNLAETILDPTLVLVSYLSLLTSSPVLLGMILPLRDGTWYLPQLWVSGYLQSIPRKIDLYRKLSLLRITCWGVVALVVNFVRNPTLILAAFFISYAVGSLASGLSGLPFLEVVGKTVAPERRGEFFAMRFGFGGLFGIGGSLLVRWLIDPAGPLAFPHNYGVLAAAYFVLASTSLLLYNGVDECADLELRPRASFWEQVRRSTYYLKRDSSFRLYILLQSTLAVAGMATPFFAIYVQQSLGGARSMVGVYLGVLMVTNLLSNLLFGRMSRKFSNQRVMQASTLIGMAMSLMVLFLALFAQPLQISPQAASLFLVPVFIFSGMRTTSMGVSSNPLLLELAPDSDRSLYIGFTNTFLGIVVLATSFSGVIMEILGFPALVSVTFLAHIFAFVAASKICRSDQKRPIGKFLPFLKD